MNKKILLRFFTLTFFVVYVSGFTAYKSIEPRLLESGVSVLDSPEIVLSVWKTKKRDIKDYCDQLPKEKCDSLKMEYEDLKEKRKYYKSKEYKTFIMESSKWAHPVGKRHYKPIKEKKQNK